MSLAVVRRGVAKIRGLCVFVSYASAILRLLSRLTQFFSFFLQMRRFFKDEFILLAFFIDDQFFVINIISN
jgi:hypothetical protein